MPTTSSIDVARARRDTPACEGQVFLDSAGSALPPAPVLDTVIVHLEREAEIGGYRAAAEAGERVEAVYTSIASLLRCDPDEVAFVDSATRAWELAFHGLGLRPGDRVLTTTDEYGSNAIAQLHHGVEMVVAPDVAAMAELVDERVKLIAVVHVPTQHGGVADAAGAGRLARAHGIPFLLDACQSVGQLDVDVQAIGCDLLAATGRKFLRGPRGTGFLYVRRGMLDRLDPPTLDMRGATWTAPDAYELRPGARRLELWEQPYALKLGLGAAVDYALGWGLGAIEARVGSLAADLRDGLRDLPGVTVHDPHDARAGIVGFTADGRSPEQVRDALAAHGVTVTVSPSTSWQLDPRAERLGALVRASPHYYNSDAEVDVAGWPRLWSPSEPT